MSNFLSLLYQAAEIHIQFDRTRPLCFIGDGRLKPLYDRVHIVRYRVCGRDAEE